MATKKLKKDYTLQITKEELIRLLHGAGFKQIPEKAQLYGPSMISRCVEDAIQLCWSEVESCQP